MQQLNGLIAVVTGGTRGIGFAIAEAMLTAGMKVCITGRSESSIERALEELARFESAVSGRICDVRDAEACAALMGEVVDTFGRIDVLVNNAGLGTFAPIQELSIEDWDMQIDTNLSGVFYCSKAAIPHLQDRGGWIINLGSLASRNAFAGGSGYNASKFGLLGLTEAMMLDLRHDNIRVSIVMPGSVDTEFFQGERGDHTAWRLQAEDIAQGVMDLLRYPSRATPSKIELRPSQPPRG